MDQLSALDQAAREFSTRVEAMDDSQWNAPTICTGWNVQTLVDHVVGGSRMATALVAGATAEEAVAVLGARSSGEPVETMRTAFAGQAASFTEPGVMTATVHHPTLDMTGEQLLGFRTLDLALHAWDLARSLGFEEQLDAELVQQMWDFIQPIAPVIGSLGIFGDGPSGNVPDTAALQTRLIDLVGRRP